MTERKRESTAAQRIRLAATEAFSEAGYSGTSTRQITQRLNMSATAIYPHYPSKEALLYAIALDGHEGLLDQMRSADDPADCYSDRLANVVRAFVAWQAEHRKLAKVVQFELGSLTPSHYRSIISLRRQASELVAAIVRGGQSCGEFDVEDPEDVALAISSLCVDVCRWFPSRRHKDPQRLGDVYAGIVARMVSNH
jgi:AcrR family transcriptional regulator